MSKAKKVDSIGPNVISTGKDQYKVQSKSATTPAAPLLSIIEPDAVALPNVHPKESLFKRIFRKKVKPVSTGGASVTKAKANKKSKDKKTDGDQAVPLASAVVAESVVANQGSKALKGKKADKKDANGERKTTFFSQHKHLVAVTSIILGVIFVLTAMVGGTAYAHQTYYANKVYPGVVVWGEDVGGKSVPEVQNLIAGKIKKYNVVLKGPDQDYKAAASDLGLIFDSEAMALSAYSQGRSDKWYENYLTRARLSLTLINWKPFGDMIRARDLAIRPSYQLNQVTLSAYLTKISDNIKIDPQDSEVIVSGASTQLKPAIYGRKVQLDTLKTEVLASIGSLESKKIVVKTDSIKPAIVDTAAQEVLLQAQNVMARPVTLSYQGVEYRPNQETVGSWITFTKAEGDTKYMLVIDQSKMDSYFSFLRSKIDVHSTAKIVRVENGVKETTTQEGVNGLLVDTSVLGSQIAAKLPVQASVALEIPTYVDAFKTEYNNVIVADWDKYIDINLSSQTMMACEKGGVNCRQWSVTTGNDGHATPVGTFLVLGRNANFYMTGGTPGVDYYKVWVDHATWFTSAGHAIHDAHWRNGSFGGQDYHWNGSHGCVNSPDDAAIFVYNWAAVGTPVTVHY